MILRFFLLDFNTPILEMNLSNQSGYFEYHFEDWCKKRTFSISRQSYCRLYDFFWRKPCVPWTSSKIGSFYVHPFNAFCVDKTLKNNNILCMYRYSRWCVKDGFSFGDHHLIFFGFSALLVSFKRKKIVCLSSR